MARYVRPEDICVCCGRYVAEGSMICPECEQKANQHRDRITILVKLNENEPADSQNRYSMLEWRNGSATHS